MKLRHIRWFAMLVVLGLFACVFLIGDSLPASWRKTPLQYQFTPSVAVIGAALVFAVLALASANVFGRVYCSAFCPAGIVQELFHRVGRLLRLGRLRYAAPAYPRAIVLFAAVAALTGSMLAANFLDPVGLFGRFAEPAGEWWRNAGRAMESFAGDGMPLLAAFLGIMLLMFVPLFRGRWFCDRLCPVGALLGLCGASGGFRVRIDPIACVACGKCEQACPTRCIDARRKAIDASRCVVCLECVAACPGNGIAYAGGGAQAGSRRSFMQSAATVALGGFFISAREAGRRLGAVLEENGADVPDIVPAGSESHIRHRQACVSCQACVPACPVGIIRPNSRQLRPVLDYDKGYCQYNCVECSLACPSGAIRPIAVSEKQETRIADTELLIERCIVVTRGEACGACAEVCPTHAVRMEERAEDLPSLPDFDHAHCIGCGACYHVCPAEPRAFVVTGIREHGRSAGVREGGHENGGKEDAPPDDGGLQEFPF